jgi:homoserine dehydrogenase
MREYQWFNVKGENNETQKLCLVGFGHIGRAFARLLQEKTAELHERYGIEWCITGVATRRLGWVADPNGLDVAALLAGSFPPEPASRRLRTVREWLAVAQADVLFEVSSLDPQTGQPAIEHLRAALEYGAHAITANKGPVVHAYSALRELAASQGKRFLFEATVMGGAPVFSLFRETLPAARVRRFRAILNSTTSVILEAMEAGNSFEEAVKIAQALGIAETDPSNDVDGWDAAVKVCALATVLMDAPLKLKEIERTGIRDLDTKTVQSARQAGRPFKLVSQTEYRDGRLIASVRPEQLTPDDPLSAVHGATLLAQFELDVLPALTITLSNVDQAGPETTAYGLFADFVSVVRMREMVQS